MSRHDQRLSPEQRKKRTELIATELRDIRKRIEEISTHETHTASPTHVSCVGCMLTRATQALASALLEIEACKAEH